MREAAALVLMVVLAGEAVEPARLRHGEAPPLPPLAAGGGHVALEVQVAADGRVTKLRTLRDAPPFTAALRAAVERWRFQPGRKGAAPVASSVLVATWFRAAALLESAGPPELPPDLVSPSDAVPLPTVIGVPPYPPGAQGEGIVVVEVEVGTTGEVQSARVVVPAAGFDAAAADAARRWRFRPASREGKAAPSVAYLVFGFRPPVTQRRP